MTAVTFDSSAAERIAAAVRRVEQQAGGAPPEPTRSPRAQSASGFYWGLHGKLLGPLNQGQYATMTVWAPDPSSGTETAAAGTVVVWDWMLKSGQSIAAGKKVFAVFDLASNRYYVLSTECG